MVRQNRTKVKRKIKKWSGSEITKILEYILQYGNLEKPTAKIYYTKLIKEGEIDANWDLVRWKVRHLKRLFQKALEWERTVGVDPMGAEDCRTIKKKLLKICPHFDLLSRIFSEKNGKIVEKIYKYQISDQPFSDMLALPESSSSRETLTTSSPTILCTPKISIASPTIGEQPVVTATTPTSPTPPALLKTEQATASAFANRMKKSVTKSGIDQLSSLQSERIKYYEKKLELEQRRLELEECKFERDVELQREKQKQDFEIRKLEIEKDERVAKYEIEMRYRTQQY